MKKFKKALALTLVFAMAASVLTGCSLFGKKKDPNAGAKTTESKQYVYKVKEIFTVDGSNGGGDIIFGVGKEDSGIMATDYAKGVDVSGNISGITSAGGKLYVRVRSQEYSDEECGWVNSASIYRMDMDGSNATKIFSPVDSNEYSENGGSSTYYNAFAVGEDGSLYFTKSSYSYSYVDDEYDWQQSCSVIRYDQNGKVLNEVTCDSEDGVNSLVVTKNGSVVAAGNTKIMQYDSNLKLIKESEPKNFGLSGVTEIANNRLLITGYGLQDYNTAYYYYDLATASFSDKLDCKVDLWNAYPGYSTDLVISMNTGIYGYNFGNQDYSLIMDFIDSDAAFSYLSYITCVDENTMIGYYSDYSDNSYTYKVVSMTKIPPEEVPDKEIILLGCMYVDANVRKMVVDFNQENEQYRIRIKDYSVYNNDDDYERGYNQLNNDIVSGNSPDIIAYNYNIPYASYVSKGLFANLEDYIKKDENINMDDYVTNVFSAFTQNGVMYMLPTGYYVNTVVAKTSLVSQYSTWNAAAMLDLWNKYPSAKMMDYEDREGIMTEIIGSSGDAFIDWEKGTCKFDTDEFRQVLELVKKFPEEINYDEEYSGDYWASYDTQWRNNKILTVNVSMSNLTDSKYERYGQFGEPISFVGYPSENGQGNTVVPMSGFSIVKKSYYKDTCWEFIRQTILPENQELQYGFPVLKSAFNKLKEEAQERPHYTLMDGSVEYYDETYYIGGEEIKVPTMTAQEAEDMYNFVTSISRAAFVDNNVIKIINEEAAAYYSGQRSAEDVSKQIQNRVQLYVSESM